MDPLLEDDIEIRAVEPSDGPSLGAIQVAIRPQLAIDFPEPHDSIARGEMWAGFLRSNPVEEFAGFVAVRSSTVVGFLISGRTDEDPGTVEVFDLYVHPIHQRQGIGARLLRTALTDFRARGCDAAVLWTAEANEGSRLFYERLGWEVDRRHEDERGTTLRYRVVL